METKIFNQDGKVIINVPALAVAFDTDEAFKLMKLFKKHIKEADEYKKAQREKSNEGLRRKTRNTRKKNGR